MEQKQLNYKYSNLSFSKGISYCVGVSLLLTLILVITNFIYILYERVPFLEAFANHISAVFFFSIIVGLISLLCAVIIGIPTVLILRKLKLESLFYSSIVGALIALLISKLIFEGWLDVQSVIMFYGFIGGYAFMHGYKKENNK